MEFLSNMPHARRKGARAAGENDTPRDLGSLALKRPRRSLNPDGFDHAARRLDGRDMHVAVQKVKVAGSFTGCDDQRPCPGLRSISTTNAPIVATQTTPAIIAVPVLPPEKSRQSGTADTTANHAIRPHNRARRRSSSSTTASIANSAATIAMVSTTFLSATISTS